MEKYIVEANGKKWDFKTRSAALVFATCEHNRIKAATGQNVRFVVREQ